MEEFVEEPADGCFFGLGDEFPLDPLVPKWRLATERLPKGGAHGN